MHAPSSSLFECLLMLAGPVLPFLLLAGPALSPLSRLCFCLLYHHTLAVLCLLFLICKQPVFPVIPQLRLLQQPARLWPVTAKAFSSPFGVVCLDHFSLQYHTDEPMGSLAVNNPQERRAVLKTCFNWGAPGKRAGACREWKQPTGSNRPSGQSNLWEGSWKAQEWLRSSHTRQM